MPFQHTLYRIDQGLKRLDPTTMEREEILEDPVIASAIPNEFNKHVTQLATGITSISNCRGTGVPLDRCPAVIRCVQTWYIARPSPRRTAHGRRPS